MTNRCPYYHHNLFYLFEAPSYGSYVRIPSIQSKWVTETLNHIDSSKWMNSPLKSSFLAKCHPIAFTMWLSLVATVSTPDCGFMVCWRRVLHFSAHLERLMTNRKKGFFFSSTHIIVAASKMLVMMSIVLICKNIYISRGGSTQQITDSNMFCVD